jgi:hypothetical protein
MKSRHTERARCAAITAGFAAAMVCAAPAGAAPGTGCAAVNRGQLSADIGASAPVTRQIVLEQGDLLSFSTSGASVALIGGAGSPATLVGGTTASAITFKAPMASAYVFQFAATGATAHVSVSCTSTTTEAANAAFLDRRKALLNARDPDRLRIDRAATPIINADKPLNSTVAVDEDGRPKDVEFSVSLSEINSATKGGKKVEPGIVDFWLEGRMQNYASTSLETGTSDGNLGSIFLGTRSMIGPDIMLGALAQFDRAVETSTFNAPGMAAKGWMAGPYVSAKLGSGVRSTDGRRGAKPKMRWRAPRSTTASRRGVSCAASSPARASSAAGTWPPASGSSTSRTPCAIPLPAQRALPAPARSRCCLRCRSALRSTM